MATIALFVAVGGTSYAAITLPRNSVGAPQIKARAVGASELRSNAVRSRDIKSGTIRTSDLARTTREFLSGRPGPAGPPGAPAIELRASFNSASELVSGNATSLDGAGPSKRLVNFGRSLAGCVPVVSVANNPGGPDVDTTRGHVVATLTPQRDRVLVEMYNASGEPATMPFNLIVAC